MECHKVNVAINKINHNDDIMMRASLWMEFFSGSFECRNSWYMEGKRDNKEWYLCWGHPFPKVSAYKRRSDNKEVDMMEYTSGVHVLCKYAQVRGCLHHGPWSCPMSKGIFSMVPFHVNISMGRFLKNAWILEVVGPMTRCRPNVDQEKWPCTR